MLLINAINAIVALAEEGVAGHAQYMVRTLAVLCRAYLMRVRGHSHSAGAVQNPPHSLQSFRHFWNQALLDIKTQRTELNEKRRFDLHSNYYLEPQVYGSHMPPPLASAVLLICGVMLLQGVSNPIKLFSEAFYEDTKREKPESRVALVRIKHDSASKEVKLGFLKVRMQFPGVCHA